MDAPPRGLPVAGPGGPPPGVQGAQAPGDTTGPRSSEARQIAAALVAKPAAPSTPGVGPALPERTAPPVAQPPRATAAPTDTPTQAVQPTAVQPQLAQRRKPPKVQPGKPTRTPQKGDLICGECAEVNAPGRKFCSRCGTSLAAAVTVRIPWWKRILPKRRPKSAMAGERPWTAKEGGKKRPKRRGFMKVLGPVRKIGGILLLVGGILYGVYSPFHKWVNDEFKTAKDKVTSIIHPKFDPVTAGPGTTSNETAPLDPAHPAVMATDGFKNTYWLSPAPSATFRPELDVQLTEKADLAKIIVRTGASDNFQGHHRPKTLLFIFDSGTQEEVSLKNTPEAQTVTIHQGKGVQNFKIAITGIYESISGTDMALTEIEFFKKG